MASQLPGKAWRVLAHNAVTNQPFEVGPDSGNPNAGAGTLFDELVVDDWFHMEQMDEYRWWARIGDLTVWIHINKKTGAVTTTVENKD